MLVLLRALVDLILSDAGVVLELERFGGLGAVEEREPEIAGGMHGHHFVMMVGGVGLHEEGEYAEVERVGALERAHDVAVLLAVVFLERNPAVPLKRQHQRHVDVGDAAQMVFLLVDAQHALDIFGSEVFEELAFQRYEERGVLLETGVELALLDVVAYLHEFVGEEIRCHHVGMHDLGARQLAVGHGNVAVGEGERAADPAACVDI